MRCVLTTGRRVGAVIVDLAESTIEVNERPMTMLTLSYEALDR